MTPSTPPKDSILAQDRADLARSCARFRRRNPLAVAMTLGTALFLVPACSDSPDAQCIRSAAAKICLVKEGPAAWDLDVSGLKPGSTLSWSSDVVGDDEVPINEAGGIDGKRGILNGLGGKARVDLSGVAPDGSVVSGTLTIG